MADLTTLSEIRAAIEALTATTRALQRFSYPPSASPIFRSLTLTVPTGTPPLDITSTTMCPNLNADLLDGQHAAAFAPASHDMLSATHGDTTAAAVVRGDVISGQGAPAKWGRLALGASNTFLRSNGTDASWQRPGIMPMGFYDNGTSAYSMVGTTFRLTGTYSYYFAGELITKTAATDDVDCAAFAAGTLRYIAFNAAGTLVAVAPAAVSFAAYVPVATVYYDGTRYVLGEERHSYVTPWEVHRWQHLTVGVRYVTGFGAALTVPTAWSIDAGTIDDDGLWTSSSVAQTQARVCYRSGTALQTPAPSSTYYSATTGVLDYDNAGALAAVSSGEYLAIWFFATPDPACQIYAVIGQRVDGNLNDARNNNTYQSLSLGTLPSPEMKLLYRVLLRRVGAAVTYVELQDLRGISNLPSGTYVATDHGTLSGLADPDHPATAINFAATARLLGRGTAAAGSGEEVALSSTNGVAFAWAAGSLAISTPQDIQVAATPQFAGELMTATGDVFTRYWANSGPGAAYEWRAGVTAADAVYRVSSKPVAGSFTDWLTVASDGAVGVVGITIGTYTNLTYATASRLLATSGSKQMASVADLTSWVAGTANQITSTSDGDGTLTLSIPTNPIFPGTPEINGSLNFTAATARTITIQPLGAGAATSEIIVQVGSSYAKVAPTYCSMAATGASFVLGTTNVLVVTGATVDLLTLGAGGSLSLTPTADGIAQQWVRGTYDMRLHLHTGSGERQFGTFSNHSWDLMCNSISMVRFQTGFSGYTQFVRPLLDVPLYDSNGSHSCTLSCASDLTANRTLQLYPGDADRTLTINGNATINDWFDQSVKTTADVTHASVSARTVRLLDSDSSHASWLSLESNLSATRQIAIYTGDADRELWLSGNAKISQDYTTSGTPYYGALGIGRAPTSGYLIDAYSASGNALGQYVGGADYIAGMRIDTSNTLYVRSFGVAISTAIFGTSLSDNTGVLSDNAVCMKLGTINACPIVIGTNDTARLTIASTGGIDCTEYLAAKELRATGDDGGVSGATSFTDVTSGISSGTGTVKMAGAGSYNSNGWIKVYIGTTAAYIPYWTTI